MTSFIKKVVRGEVSIPIAVFVSVLSIVFTGFAGMVFSTTTKISTDVQENTKVDIVQGERITTLETKVERLPYLEAKVDKLLENQGIDPKKVLPASIISATKP